MSTTISGNQGVSQIQAGATSGGLPVFQCRAWVNFDGTRDSTGANSTANTARFIRASGNVTSVIKNAVGDYTVNFTTAMPDNGYAVSFMTTAINTVEATVNTQIRVAGAGAGQAPELKTATQLRFIVGRTNSLGLVDQADVSCIIFR